MCNDERSDLLKRISAVIRQTTNEFISDADVEAAARLWLEANFEDAEEVAEWHAARCFDAQSAKQLDDAGITPEQAALRTREGDADYEETIGYKFAHGDLSLSEARRIITNEFWNN